MKIAMEIPDVHLEELSQHVDFDFCLTHMLLQEGPSSTYARFYRKQRENGREVWLDNSFHELGFALPEQNTRSRGYGTSYSRSGSRSGERAY